MEEYRTNRTEIHFGLVTASDRPEMYGCEMPAAAARTAALPAPLPAPLRAPGSRRMPRIPPALSAEPTSVRQRTLSVPIPPLLVGLAEQPPAAAVPPHMCALQALLHRSGLPPQRPPVALGRCEVVLELNHQLMCNITREVGLVRTMPRGIPLWPLLVCLLTFCFRPVGADHAPHLRRDRAQPQPNQRMSARNGLTPPTSAPGLGSPLPHLRRDRAQPRPNQRMSARWFGFLQISFPIIVEVPMPQLNAVNLMLTCTNGYVGGRQVSYRTRRCEH
jgi:hypothetical protein